MTEHYRSDFCNYADDTTPYNCGARYLDLEATIDNLSDWFYYNNFKVNPSKCNLFPTPSNLKSISIKNSSMEGNSSEKFLGVTVDSNFRFQKHINESYKKGNQNIPVLARCAKHMSTAKRQTLLNTFVRFQFSSCLLVWVFHTKELNNKIHSLLEKDLRLTHQNRNSSFDQLLKIVKSASIHYSKFQYLLTEKHIKLK